MFRAPKRSALLVDFENVVRPPDNSLVAKIPNWIAWLENGEFDAERRRRKFLSKRVYWNSHCEGNRPIFERQGFDAFACPAAVKDKKSAADIWIALDAIDLTIQHRDLEEVIIISTDTDFVPVVNRLREKEKDVVVLVNEANLSANVYPLHADAVIRLTDLQAAVSYVPPKRGWFNFGDARKPKHAAPETSPSRPATSAPTTVAPSLRKAAAAPPSTPRVVTAGTFDLEAAAALIVQAASVQPGQFISKETVRNVLRGVPGFATTGRHPWLGCGSYRNMLDRLATLRSELEVIKDSDRGRSVRLRKG